MLEHLGRVGEGFLTGLASVVVGVSIEILCVVTVDDSSVESETCFTF
jgi:hypothetical protein